VRKMTDSIAVLTKMHDINVVHHCMNGGKHSICNL
jgi:hypothetical protein